MFRVAAGLALLVLITLPLHAAIPPGFTDALVASVGAPTAIAFTPDGTMLITTQSGSVRLYRNGALLASPALTFPASAICSNSERGLLGIAVDPDFDSNGNVFLFYTAELAGGSCTNRLSRFTFTSPDAIDIASELILIDNMPSPAGNHNAGDVQIGKDGNVYLTIGDGGCDYAGDSGCAGANDAARDQHVLTGKVLRITRSGGIPADNPFQGAGTARCNVTGMTTPGNKCQETFAWGLRNPFRIAFDPNAVTTRFFINDVGQNVREEIDEGAAGADYGWNCREGTRTNSTTGKCNPTPAGMVDPLFEYAHNQTVPGTSSTANCNSITGGAFVPNGLWPGYDSQYLFSDYVCGWIFRLSGSAGTYAAADFATSLGSSSAVTLAFGPWGNSQALYYTTYAGGGQVRRISYAVPGNNTPIAVIAAAPLSGAPPLTVNFDGSGSSDPDQGDTLTWFWDFGDGATSETASATTSHTYTASGSFTASLRVRDNNFAFSEPVSLVIQTNNTPPSAAIVVPTVDATFGVGDSVSLQGTAADAEDGTLGPAAFSWSVKLHHGNHDHPLVGPLVGNPVNFTAPAPEDLAATNISYLIIELTVTDSSGLQTTVVQNMQPDKVNLTFGTKPTRLALTLNASAIATPVTVVSWRGYSINVDAPSPQTHPEGQSATFIGWSDGGAQSHAITTPAADATYTATFGVPSLLVSSLTPDSGPASGTTVSVDGANFTPSSAVHFGGATIGSTFVDPYTLSVTTPPVTAGSLTDVAVSDGGNTEIAPRPFFADFLDVAAGHLFHDFVEGIARAAITGGCGGGNYCPNSQTTRAQMAVFLLRAKHGSAYTPPPASGTLFADVPAGSFAAAWIEQLAAEGITAGCGGGNYCPGAATSRAQMAVFLLAAKEGSGYTPPAATGEFDDVPVSSPFAPWIEELAARGITGGCAPNLFCPNAATTRGQMAVFLFQTFLR